MKQRLAVVILLAGLVGVGILSGPAGFGPGQPQSAEATSLSEIKKLLASDAQPFDFFGFSVALSGDTAVVGAYTEDAGGDAAGAAYILQRDEGGADNWGEVKKLTASDAQVGDQFGGSVAVSGDTAVVGAVGENAGGAFTGAVYVFQRDQGGADNWGEVTKLTASDAQAADWFGISVAVAGDTVVVGAHQAGFGDGAAYVFQRNQGGADNWGEVTKLTASDAQAGDLFGWNVAVSGDTAVVGAVGENAGDAFTGAAYIFQRNEGGADNWGEVKKLTASDAGAEDWFGFSVAVSGDTAIVGAYREGLNGFGAGAAYVFRRDQGGADNWGEVKKLTASDAEAGDQFGRSVAVSGGTAVVGASGVDAGGDNAGAAYVFQEPAPTPTDTPTATPTPTPTLPATATLVSPAPATPTPTPTLPATATPVSPAPATPTPTPTLPATATPASPAPATPTPTGDLPGDVGCDGTVNSIDAALVLQFIAGMVASLACQQNADVNGDSTINTIDAALILQFAAGLIDSLPASAP